MAIQDIALKTDSFTPGENLAQDKGTYTHITISYDITGNREKIDRFIEEAIESDHQLQKIECVNTTLYWQALLDDESRNDEGRNSKIKAILKEKLKEIFVNQRDPSRETVTAFCMVGNIRAFAFKIDA